MGVKGFRLADDQGVCTIHMLCGYFRYDGPPKIHEKGSLRTTAMEQDFAFPTRSGAHYGTQRSSMN
jgi:hypothetical protein